VLTALDGDALVVESYGWARSQEALETGGWGSFEPEDLRRSDQWFLEYSGIGEILHKHDVEFLNITEENWGNRTTDRALIEEVVTAKHAPLEREDFYGFIPCRLYELRGCDLLSLAKVRVLEDPMKVSLAIKNFFGMIPGPGRGAYHGKKHSKLDQSILDIYKLYDSLFNVSGIVEALLTASLRDSDTFDWHTHENPGFLSASANPLELDAVVTALLGIDPHSVGYLELASQTFGPWSDHTIKAVQDTGIHLLDEITNQPT
jgi:hypothetical protein